MKEMKSKASSHETAETGEIAWNTGRDTETNSARLAPDKKSADKWKKWATSDAKAHLHMLQYPDRDTQKCAVKCSEIYQNGNAVPVYKDPVTDAGKLSKKGRLALVKLIKPIEDEGTCVASDANGGLCDCSKCEATLASGQPGRLVALQKDCELQECKKKSNTNWITGGAEVQWLTLMSLQGELLPVKDGHKEWVYSSDDTVKEYKKLFAKVEEGGDAGMYKEPKVNEMASQDYDLYREYKMDKRYVEYLKRRTIDKESVYTELLQNLWCFDHLGVLYDGADDSQKAIVEDVPKFDKAQYASEKEKTKEELEACKSLGSAKLFAVPEWLEKEAANWK